jgi:hypothetical protein
MDEYRASVKPIPRFDHGLMVRPSGAPMRRLVEAHQRVCSCSREVEATSGFEPLNRGFAELGMTLFRTPFVLKGNRWSGLVTGRG